MTRPHTAEATLAQHQLALDLYPAAPDDATFADWVKSLPQTPWWHTTKEPSDG